MSVRKRTWTTRKGERKEVFVVDYAVNGNVVMKHSRERMRPSTERHRSGSICERPACRT